MTPEMKELAEALFNRACYEAASAGNIGEEVLLNARDESIRAVRLVAKDQINEFYLAEAASS